MVHQHSSRDEILDYSPALMRWLYDTAFARVEKDRAKASRTMLSFTRLAVSSAESKEAHALFLRVMSDLDKTLKEAEPPKTQAEVVRSVVDQFNLITGTK